MISSWFAWLRDWSGEPHTSLYVLQAWSVGYKLRPFTLLSNLHQDFLISGNLPILNCFGSLIQGFSQDSTKESNPESWRSLACRVPLVDKPYFLSLSRRLLSFSRDKSNFGGTWSFDFFPSGFLPPTSGPFWGSFKHLQTTQHACFILWRPSTFQNLAPYVARDLQNCLFHVKPQTAE